MLAVFSPTRTKDVQIVQDNVLTLKNFTVTWYVNGIDIKGVTNFKTDDSQFSKVKNWRTILEMTNISPELAGEIKCSYECGIGPPVTSKTMLK